MDDEEEREEETDEQPIGEAETEEGPIEMDNTYMSYSMATGDFTRDGIDGLYTEVKVKVKIRARVKN